MADLNIISQEQFKEYAIEANGRSTICAQDGLKPVHRRILFSLLKQGLRYNKPFKVSQAAAGAVLDYHPHGDTSVYDAMVRLSQPFKMRYSLVDFYGSNGSEINDRYAASRYTKVRLNKIGELMLQEINKNTVPMVDNYSGEEKEPVFLPSIFPNILVNPSLGVGIGMSCNTLPHNLNEVCDALLAYIDNPSITIKEIMNYIKGPDFPTGGIITNGNKLEEIYSSGKGSITLKANYHLKTIDGRVHIIVTQLPYLVSIEKHIIQPIKRMIEEEETTAIYNFEDHSGKNGIELHIILEKNVNVNKVIDLLLEKTGLQTTIKVNNTVNRNNSFVCLNLKGLMLSYLNHRHNCIINSSRFDLEVQKKELNILLGLVIALANIEEVVELIKKASKRADAKEKLMVTFELNEEQANAILDMKLVKLTSLEIEKIKEDIRQHEERIKELEEIISNKAKRNEIIKGQLLSIKKDFGDERRTLITVDLDEIVSEEIAVILKEDGMVASVPIKNLGVSNKGIKGSFLTKEKISDIIITKTNETLLCFSEDGKMYPIKVNNIPIINNLKEKGCHFSELVDCEKVVKLAALVNDKQYVVFITKNGLVKKTEIDSYRNFKKAVKALNLKPNDALLDVLFMNNNEYLMLLGDNHKVAKYLLSEVRATGRETFGSIGIAADKVLSCCAATDGDKIITWSDEKGKITPVEEFPTSSKGSSGVLINENCIGLNNIANADKVAVIGADGRAIIIETSEISVKGYKTAGSKILNGKINKILVA